MDTTDKGTADIGTTGIIPFTYLGGLYKRAGSTSLRVDQLVAAAPDFKYWVHGSRYDNLIFQKAYWPEMMKTFNGPKILDVCDPDWFQESLDIVETGNLAHAITCSSEALTQLMRSYFPAKIVECVPDRLDFHLFPPPRGKHQGTAKNVVWFGFIHNAHETLAPLLPALTTYGLRLRIIADKPYSQEDGILELEPEFEHYDPATIYSQLKEADIVLNPRSNRAFYRYKSDNKSVIGWKLGLPVAVSEEDLVRFLNPDKRNEEVQVKRLLVDKGYRIEKSALQYREIISKIRELYF